MGCFQKSIYADTRPTKYNCNDENEYGLTYVSIYNQSGYYSTAFIGETSSYEDSYSEQGKANYREDLNPGLWGDLYSRISLCKNSKSKSILRIGNTKITNNSIVGNSSIYNSYIENSEVDVSNSGGDFNLTEIRDSKISGYLSIEKSSIRNLTEINTSLNKPACNCPMLFIKNLNIDNSNISVDESGNNIQYYLMSENPINANVINSTLKNMILSNISGPIPYINILDSVILDSTAMSATGIINQSLIKNSSYANTDRSIIGANLDHASVTALSVNLSGNFTSSSCYYNNTEFTYICTRR